MSRVRCGGLPTLYVLALSTLAGCGPRGDAPSETPLASGGVPLYSDLGTHAYRVETAVPAAQAYFDQGLRLYYAFNHAEAIRAFREAQRLDPRCAMCWWGEALAWGPNINLPMDSASAVAAYAAESEALARREDASDSERALIDALATRYVAEPADDRAHLDQAYADAMRSVAARYPDDDEVVVLFGESLLDLRPWDYWADDGSPNPGIADALAGFERVLASDPNHPGACHFFIHTVEELYPERAVPCAERLASLMPGAGHLVHMPGHIYVRVGRYAEAVEANRHAVHADETYIRDQHPEMGMYTAGYYPHNYDFMAFAAAMIGQSATAIDAANKVAGLIPNDMFGAPGMDFLQHWSTRPYQIWVRFGRWEDILAAPAPPADRLHALAMWHYARGRALAATGDLVGAREQLEFVKEAAASDVLRAMRLEYNQSADLLTIAASVLEGWIASAAANHDAAVRAMEAAVRAEGRLRYGEPPEWSIPTREDLGVILQRAGRPADAERAFRSALDQFPANGWSLWGLSLAIRGQGKNAEADSVLAEFERAWAAADVEVGG